MAYRKVSDRAPTGIIHVHYSASEAKLLGIDLNYVNNGDTNGLFYYLGKLTTGTWSNPHTSGQIRVIGSSDGTGSPERLVNRTTGHSWYTANAENSFAAFDIGANRKLLLKNILIRHDDESGYFLRNFKIRGSNNVLTNTPSGIMSATWTDLAVFANNTIINSVEGWGLFFMTLQTEQYRWFQIFQNGANSNGNAYLVMGQAELYGILLVG